MSDQALTWDDVIPLLPELRTIALGLLSHEGQAHSVQPSELVQTALRRQKPGGWKTPFDQVEVTWENRGQFFGQMHRAMVQALIERGRQRNRVRQIKTVQLENFTPDDFRSTAKDQPELFEALAQALETMGQTHADWMDLAAYLIWEELTQAEAARMLGVVEKTVQRRWDRIRLWLRDEINRLLAEDVK